MSEKSLLKDKTFSFAVRIIKLYKHLTEVKKEFILSKQILRCGTAIGAMIREGRNAESKMDFVHKFSLAQKECDETLYWLELLCETQYITDSEFKSIYSDANSILKLIKSSIITVKNSLKK